MLKVKEVSETLKDADREQLIEIVSKLTGVSNEAEVWFIKEYGDSSNPAERGRRVELWLIDAWKQIKPYIKEANLLGCIDHDNEEFVYEMMTYMAEPEDIELASWTVRKKLINEMAKEYVKGCSDFDDGLFDIMGNLCVTDKEREYLKGRVK